MAGKRVPQNKRPMRTRLQLQVRWTLNVHCLWAFGDLSSKLASTSARPKRRSASFITTDAQSNRGRPTRRFLCPICNVRPSPMKVLVRKGDFSGARATRPSRTSCQQRKKGTNINNLNEEKL